MIPYSIGTVLPVAAPGGHEAENADAIFGKMRSRAGAKLKYTINDVNALRKNMPTYGAYVDGELISYELIDPSIDELIETIDKIILELSDSPNEDGRKKVFNIIYAGHGLPGNGAWELRDGTISGVELHEAICKGYDDDQNKLHIDLILDSCYSGSFLIDFLVSAQSNETVYPFDCVASSLPDEKSWEISFLEHGAMSFHLTHPGNSYVDPAELARAVDQKDLKFVVRALQGVAPNPVTLLTNGRQHSVLLVSGHVFEVQGAGSFELADHFGKLTHLGITNALEKAKTAYGKSVEYKV